MGVITSHKEIRSVTHQQSNTDKVTLDKANKDETNKKIYRFVVLGWMFVGLGALLVGATLAVAFIFTPIAFVGLIPAIALTILGITWSQKHALSSETPSIEELDEDKSNSAPPPFVPGQPLGLKNLTKSNCWLNTDLQIILNSQELIRCIRLQQVDFPLLNQAIDAYQEAQQNSSKCTSKWVAPVNTSEIRAELSRVATGLNQKGQEDANEGMIGFFANLDDAAQRNSSLYSLKKGVYMEPGTTDRIPNVDGPRDELTNEIRFALPVGCKDDFQTLLFGAFRSNLDVNIGGGDRNVDKHDYYESHPEQFFLTVNRFYFGQNKKKEMVQKKNDAELDVPENFYLPEELLPNEDFHYPFHLKSFAVHAGDSATSGHYYAYVYRNNSWWRCDDARITQVKNQKQFEKDRKNAYFYFYERNPSDFKWVGGLNGTLFE